MTYIISVLIFIAVATGVHCQVFPELEELSRQMLQFNNNTLHKFIKDKIEAVCPGKYEEFQNATQEARVCTELKRENQTGTMCSNIQLRFTSCINPVTKVFEECLPEKNREIPNYVVEAARSLLHYLCSTDAQHIIELYNPCLRKKTDKSMKCVKEAVEVLTKNGSKNVSKNEVCIFVASLKSCLHTHADDNCGNELTKKSMLNIYDTFLIPCPKT